MIASILHEIKAESKTGKCGGGERGYLRGEEKRGTAARRVEGGWSITGWVEQGGEEKEGEKGNEAVIGLRLMISV